jgi:hypothetical protein
MNDEAIRTYLRLLNARDAACANANQKGTIPTSQLEKINFPINMNGNH